ncbi:TetR/AcrR family transcriptional regulator [Amycolatopsis regifaucium]|uniref:TetR family transcriptional regulator n=1 Tax=Amycolatopsis regifaucium TaxID=546365 RepID=A0A154M588_9PSEU|nr:TetR/AcrR family transcriptional regulator [Amycolatopsis regifaucium]KZB79801.1 TetR family transcriptional regulator [Amycolatopsis regifaucium]OKA09881.1 TetR family transcriptional regulator [Amycolatopsis regifaucium]SFI71394.1 DNA-binding transcriptional regulator, AcrR family [Amycolatopsis regifaucium]
MGTRARERLLSTAEELFYAEGIRAVGIDRILDESGVGKASLYRHFPSKEALVEAVLRERDRTWRQWLSDAVDGYRLDPADRVLAVFDALYERFSRKDFRGCAFINTMVETADPSSPVHAVAAEHKVALTGYLAGLLADAGRAGAAELAEQLVLVVDGSIVTAVRENSPDAALRGKSIAAALLR